MTKTRKKFLFRGALVVGLGALLVGAMLTPSLGGSFLTKKKANKSFIKKAVANNTFLKKSDADGFLKKADAVKTATAFSTTLPALSNTSTTDTDIPGATATVTSPGPATLSITFNAISLCTSGTSGFRCAIKVLVDGATADPTPDATGYDFDSTVLTTNSVNRALSLTVSKQVAAGAHTVKIVSTGLNAGSTFTLRVWHLQVQSLPN